MNNTDKVQIQMNTDENDQYLQSMCEKFWGLLFFFCHFNFYLCSYLCDLELEF